LGIIGENGSGKSTLLRIIAGVTRPTSGNIAVHGRISTLLELAAGFNPQFTGRENIYLNASILGFTDAQTRQRIPDIERFAEIGNFIDRPVKVYSTGRFVRLAFAVASHMEPHILMMEEGLGKALPISADLELPDAARSRIPKFIEQVTNVDHRHGNGKALVRGIGVFSQEGNPATAVIQGNRICVRVSVEFLDECLKPNVGFILRNRLGEDVTGTNASFEGVQLPPARSGDRI